MTPIDWATVGAIVTTTLTGTATAVVRWIVPGIRLLAVAPAGGMTGANGERRAEAKDFGTLLERLANLAELNERSQTAAAIDRESLRDGLAEVAIQSSKQTDVLANLVRMTEATLASSQANGQAIATWHPRRRRRDK